jgi:hypothetical protein
VELIKNQPEVLLNPPEGLELNIDWASLIKRGMVQKTGSNQVGLCNTIFVRK